MSKLLSKLCKKGANLRFGGAHFQRFAFSTSVTPGKQDDDDVLTDYQEDLLDDLQQRLKPMTSTRETRTFQAFAGNFDNRGMQKFFVDHAHNDEDRDGIPDDVPVAKSAKQMRERFPEYFKDYSDTHLTELLCNRSGKLDESFMITAGLHNTVRAGEAFELTEQGLKQVLHDAHNNPRNIGAFSVHSDPPKCADVVAIWTHRALEHGDASSNALGDNHSLTMAQKIVDVPQIPATEEGLSYYGATLIQLGEHFEFPQDREYPIWAMNIGKNYVDGYIMDEDLGGGMFLEYHMDLPHFHMPLSGESGGALILGRKLNDFQYRLTAFQIPFGYAVYTSCGALHNDSTCTGPWLMGYDGSVAFSTALLIDKNSDIVKLNPLSYTN